MKNEYRFSNDKCIISLQNGRFETVIDKSDFEIVDSFKGTWYANYFPTAKGYYVQGSVFENGKTKQVRLHRLIMNENNPNIFIDHINHDTLNNSRENLRKCTRTQNTQNIKDYGNNKNGFIGVSYHKRDNLYIARIQYNGKQKNIGYFKTAEDAHFAYITTKRKIHEYNTL